MGGRIKRICNGITTALVAMAVILAMLLAGARLVGLQAFTVLSGSMEPAYHVGSLIYVKGVDPEKLESGDVITYRMNGNTVVTHRIIEVVPDETGGTKVSFRTKGDANNVEDGALVPGENVMGSPVFTIPWLGYVSVFIQSPSGFCVACSAVLLLLALGFLPDLLGGKTKDSDNNHESEETIREVAEE